MEWVQPNNVQSVRGIPIGRLDALEKKVNSMSGGGGSPGGSNGELQYKVNSTTFGGMTDTFYSPSAAALPGASHQFTFGRTTVFQSDNDLSDSFSILYINNGKLLFADDNQAGLVTGVIGQANDSSGDVEFVNPHGGWRVTSGNVGILTTKAATRPLQIGDGNGLTVPDAPTSGSGVIPGYNGSYTGYTTVGTGSSGYIQTTTTIRVYAYNTDSINYLFSKSYLELSVTDDGSSGAYYIDWAWNDSGADGYRILVQNSEYGYSFNYYYDHTLSGSVPDFIDQNTWTLGSTVTPNTNLEKFFVTTAGVGYFQSDLKIDGNFTTTGAAAISGDITGRGIANNLTGKLAVGTSRLPAVNLVVGDYVGGGTADGVYAANADMVVNSKYGHQLTLSDGWTGNGGQGNAFWVLQAGSDGGPGSIAFISTANQVSTFLSTGSSQALLQFGSLLTGLTSYFGMRGDGTMFFQNTQNSTKYTDMGDGNGTAFYAFRAGDFSSKLSLNTHTRILYKTDGSTTAVDWGGLTLNGIWSTGGTFIIPKLATPTAGTFTTATTGGTLAQNTTYYYRVSATDGNGGETLAFTEVSKLTGNTTATNTITVVWAQVTGATGYKIYGRTTGAELLIGTISSGSTLSFTDTGSVTPSGALPVKNTTGSVQIGGGITKYNNIATEGNGVPAIFKANRITAQTSAQTVATYTTPASDGSYEVSANVLVTTSTTHSFTVTCTYTDEGNTSRTLTLPFSVLSGTIGTTIANAAGAVPYEGVPLHIRCKASTSITIATVGTFTTVTYNAEGIIKQTI